MKLVIVLFAVVVAVSAHPGLVDPWAGSQVAVAAAPHAIPWAQPQHAYVSAPVAHPQVYAHAPVAVHQQLVKVHQPPPIPPLAPQPLNIKIPHTQSVRLPTGHVKIATPHLIGVQVAAPEPAPIIAKHAVHAPVVHAPVHSW